MVTDSANNNPRLAIIGAGQLGMLLCQAARPLGISTLVVTPDEGAPALGIQGAALATLVTATVMLIAMTVYAVTRRELRRYALMKRLHVPDWAALGEVFRLGWPISLTLLAEISLISISSVMMGWLGVLPLAAHKIALQVAAVIFMIPLGLTFAGTVRVGRAVGRKDTVGLYRASVTVTAIAREVAGCTWAVACEQKRAPCSCPKSP